jgi:hypothetical protein
MAVTLDGRLWQWQVALPRYPRRSFLADSDEPIAAINSSIQVCSELQQRLHWSNTGFVE